MSYQSLRIEHEDAVAVVTINRPAALNALNAATIGELEAAFGALAADSTVRAIVITGAGERAFVAGADIAELRALGSASEAEALARRGQALFAAIEHLPKPVIAAINGFALGGGCELAMACDVRIASEKARLGQPEINLGIIPGYGGTQRLPRLVGRGAAKWLVFSGEIVDAAEALRLGLLDRVVPAADLLHAAKEMARKLAEKPPLALAAAKRAINEGTQTDLERGCALEAALFAAVCATHDREEGTSAFLEKRPPKFEGR